jgi:hypothetical protein
MRSRRTALSSGTCRRRVSQWRPTSIGRGASAEHKTKTCLETRTKLLRHADVGEKLERVWPDKTALMAQLPETGFNRRGATQQHQLIGGCAEAEWRGTTFGFSMCFSIRLMGSMKETCLAATAAKLKLPPGVGLDEFKEKPSSLSKVQIQLAVVCFSRSIFSYAPICQ